MGPLETEVRALWRAVHVELGMVEPTLVDGKPGWLVNPPQLDVMELLALHAAQMNALLEGTVRLARALDGGDEDPAV
jgi:hypothetical protein